MPIQSRKKLAPRLAALGATAWLVGCGTPTLIDLDGRPLKEPELLACVQGGWLAVDSSDSGIRAVLKMRGESDAVDRTPWDLSTLELRVGAEDPVAPSRLSNEDPRCSAAKPRSAEPAREAQAEAADRPPAETGLRCLHVVRVEFILPRLPTADDSVTLKVGDKTSPVRWRLEDGP